MSNSMLATGERFGRLVVLRHERGNRYRCRCQCGAMISVYGANLKAGRSKSCGCLRDELARERPVTHGLRRGGRKHPLYEAWCSMKKRCANPRDKSYVHYGGRGIKVCDRWLGRDGFPNFVADMGPRPAGLVLDRIDNDGHYEPSNCRWATYSESNLNRRRFSRGGQ